MDNSGDFVHLRSDETIASSSDGAAAALTTDERRARLALQSSLLEPAEEQIFAERGISDDAFCVEPAEFLLEP